MYKMTGYVLQMLRTNFIVILLSGMNTNRTFLNEKIHTVYRKCKQRTIFVLFFFFFDASLFCFVFVSDIEYLFLFELSFSFTLFSDWKIQCLPVDIIIF